jgi:hypothetical protein
VGRSSEVWSWIGLQARVTHAAVRERTSTFNAGVRGQRRDKKIRKSGVVAHRNVVSRLAIGGVCGDCRHWTHDNLAQILAGFKRDYLSTFFRPHT